MSPRLALALAAVAGIVLQVGISLGTGRPEAWDSTVFWTGGLPAAILFCGVLGYAAPRRFSLYGPTLMAAQFLTLILMSGSGALLPVGIVLSGVLSLPAILCAGLGARIRSDRPGHR